MLKMAQTYITGSWLNAGLFFRDWGCGPSLSGGENSHVFPVLGKIINPFFQIIGNTDVIIILIKTSKENFYSSLYSKMTFPW